MSHIHVRKSVEGHYPFAGKDWWYDYGPEIRALEEASVKKFVTKKWTTFSKLSKSWNDELNTEWVCRVFWAAKMIMAASLMLESLEYARDKNLKVSVPYLQYYSLLYSLKALVVVLPGQRWNNGSLIEQTHTKTINVACTEVAKLDKRWNNQNAGSDSIKEQILKLKAFRELISYRAPSSGGSFEKYDIDLLHLCKVPVELAQMVSEILEEAIHKNLPHGCKPQLIETDLETVFRSEIGNHQFFDEEDYYRIGYLLRKHPLPTNVLHIMSEGHVEDFFGSWCDADEREEVFDPDKNWRILFDVP